MRMIDIITKKRDGKALTKEEIEFFVKGYTNETIPDYQASALLMAIYFQGMNNDEIVNLTNAMEFSGDIIDLSSVKGVKVDKHSTGGVGDKNSLIIGPIVASCGATFAIMSGRGLGHTGGTLDKLESIPGFNVFLTQEQYKKQLNEIGYANIGQTGKLVPADKKMYALRDVTSTVDSIPLIASSIMSKKLASGDDKILLDVKYGNGAFMKTKEKSIELAKLMCQIGKSVGKDTKAIISNMDQPTGFAIGNSLEVIEAINTLQNKGPKDLTYICVESAAIMLVQANICKSIDEARNKAQKSLEDGSAFNKFIEMVKYQGGDISYILDTSKFEVSKNIIEIFSKQDGYIKEVHALTLGLSGMKLGAGREKIIDKVDPTAGIVITKKVGDKVSKGELLATIYTNKEHVEDIVIDIEKAFVITNDKTEPISIIDSYID